VVYHMELDMVETPSCSVKIVSISYVETVKYWRKVLQEIVDASKALLDFPQERKRRLTATISIQPFKKKRMIPSPLSPTQRLQLVKMNINELAFRVSGKTINFPDNQKIEVFLGGILIIYEPDFDQIVLQSSVVRNIPHTVHPSLLMPLMEKLLSGSTFGSLMLGGGVGMKKEGEDTFQIMMYAPLRMKHIKNERGLIEFVPQFKEIVERWQKIVLDDIRSHVKPAPKKIENKLLQT